AAALQMEDFSSPTSFGSPPPPSTPSPATAAASAPRPASSRFMLLQLSGDGGRSGLQLVYHADRGTVSMRVGNLGETQQQQAAQQQKPTSSSTFPFSFGRSSSSSAQATPPPAPVAEFT